MEIKFNINKELKDIQIDIYAPSKTEEVSNILKLLEEYYADKLYGIKDGEIYEIKLEDVICFFTDKKGVYLKTNKGIFKTKYRMYELEEKYTLKFLRISNAVIVNTSHVKCFDTSYIDNVIVKLDDGTQEFVSKRRISTIIKMLKEGRLR